MGTRERNHYQLSKTIAQLNEQLQLVADNDAKVYLEECVATALEEFGSAARGQSLLSKLPASLERSNYTELSKDEMPFGWTARFIGTLEETKMGYGTQCLIISLSGILLGVAYRQNFLASGTAATRWLDRNMDSLVLNGKWSLRGNVLDAIHSSGVPTYELFIQPNKSKRGGASNTVGRIEFDTDSEFVRRIVMAALNKSPYRQNCEGSWGKATAIKEFTKSMGFVPTRLDDFTVDTFSRQFEYLDGIPQKYEHDFSLKLLVRIYAHVMDCLPDGQSQFTYKTGLTRAMILQHNFPSAWRSGFRAAVHVPTDPVPTNPKWFLYPSEEEMRRTNIRFIGSMVDTSYRDPALQRLLSAWLWSECENVNAMRRIPGAMKALLDELEAGKNCTRYKMTGAGITRAVANLRERMNASGVRHWKAAAKSLLSYGERIGVIEVDATAHMLLEASERCARQLFDSTGAANKENLGKLATRLAEKSGESLIDELVYCAFVVISLSPLRLSEVLGIRIGDLSEDKARGIRSVRVSTKTDGNGFTEVQLVGEAYRLLLATVRLTEPVRMSAPPDISKYLFIYASRQHGETRMLSGTEFRCRLSSTCKELGIEDIGARSIRKRYETEIVLQSIRRSLNVLQIRPLTGHASIRTTYEHYVRPDVREYFESVYGVEIGIPRIEGVISDDPAILGNICTEENAVEGGAGYCRNESCNIAGVTTCLMCRSFLTTPRCIPEMEEALEIIRRRLIENALNSHEREHLIAVKRLYLGYLAVMESMRLGRSEGE
ncbi:MAG: site-specific integrase [Atopobiaceae bacterium]|nr:site-specific integrase [Atopobiaceae bacterium]